MLSIFAVSACSQNIEKQTMEKKKILVVYFSATGTTRQVAKQIAKIADADICEIVPVQPYSDAKNRTYDMEYKVRASRRNDALRRGAKRAFPERVFARRPFS